MSTSYFTNPTIQYEEFLKKTTLEIIEPKQKVYINENKGLHYNENYLRVLKTDDGNCEFIRHGINESFPLLAKIIEDFNVEIIDEYGLKYPDCMG